MRYNCFRLAVVSLLPAFLTLLLAGCAQSRPAGSAEQKSYAFWPRPPQNPRIQFLTAFSSSRDITGRKNKLDEFLYGSEGEKDLDLDKPYGVAMWEGKIYAADTRNSCIVVLDLRKKELRLMGATGPGKLSKPVDIAIAPDGIKYVADTGRSGVIVFDDQNRYVKSLGREGLRPVSVAVRGNDLYVCDIKSGRIEVLDRNTGQTLRAIGTPGREEGQLAGPLGIDLDAEGNLYVSDMLNFRIQVFSPDGKPKAIFGGQGYRHGTFTRPKHLAVDSSGVLYIVDAAFQNVQMFSTEGRLLMNFGNVGSHPGSMDLPAGVCVHEGDLDLFQQYIHPAFQAERLIIVTNQLGLDKVSVYAMGHVREGMSIDAKSSKLATMPSDKELEAMRNIFTGMPTTAPAETVEEPPATRPTTRPAGGNGQP